MRIQNYLNFPNLITYLSLGFAVSSIALLLESQTNWAILLNLMAVALDVADGNPHHASPVSR